MPFWSARNYRGHSLRRCAGNAGQGDESHFSRRRKKQFKGNELVGKTLGVVGLGAIGSMVAEMALTMGMEGGHDPALSVEAAWRLAAGCAKAGHTVGPVRPL